MAADNYRIYRRSGTALPAAISFLALLTIASCTFETNTAQGTRRGILQGIVRDGTLGIIEEAQPSSQEDIESQEGQPAGDAAAATTSDTPSPTPSPSVGLGVRA